MEFPRELKTLHCRYCGAEFKQARPWQAYCKPEHAAAWHKARRKKSLEIFETIERVIMKG